MTRIWYCVNCGYEVDRGGRCHNCKHPLTASALPELAEGEVDDELGYRLGDWEDSSRGELIAALIDQGIRHRFEGDELVVAAADEDQVDALMATLSGVSRGGAALDSHSLDSHSLDSDSLDSDSLDSAESPDLSDSSELSARRRVDAASLAAIDGLYDAARRLRADPTDMIADGDLAESSARVLASDDLHGADLSVADRNTWAAVGRVTRRLLGALGAEEAMEEEIVTQAGILCRLLDPVVADLHGRTGPSGVDEVEEDNDELVYELPDWLPEERAQLSLLLDRDHVPYQWEDADLIIPEADEGKVESLFEEVDRFPAGGLPEAPDGTDDEAEYQILSDLFGAADRLAGVPDDKRRRIEIREAAAAVAGWSTPFAMTDDQWWQVQTRANAISDAIDAGADLEVVAQDAAILRNLLRGFM